MKLFRMRKKRATPENTEEVRRKALQNEFKSAFRADLEDMTRRAAKQYSLFRPAGRGHVVGKASTFSVAAE